MDVAPSILCTSISYRRLADGAERLEKIEQTTTAITLAHYETMGSSL